MLAIVRHIVIYLSAIMIVAATGGIGLVQHFCSCEGDVSLRMAADAKGFFTTGEGLSCCVGEPQPQPGSCCELPAREDKEPDGHQCHSEKQCCSEQYSFLKTDQFNLAVSPVEFHKYAKGLTVQPLPAPEEEPSKLHLVSRANDRSPPGMSGRNLLIRLHQLKTDPLAS